MSTSNFPLIRISLPGPISRALSDKLKDFEASGISSTMKGNIPIFWNSGMNTKVLDVDNNEYIDCTSSFGVAGIGYSHPILIKELQGQLELIIHTMCEINPHEAYASALESIIRAVGRLDNSQVLLTLSGSEAVEVALKLSYRYTHKPGIIAFHGSFHGQSLGALSATSHNCFRDPFFPLIPNNVMFAAYPNSYRSNKNEAELLSDTIDSLEQMISNGRSGGLPIGSIIVEPMQNASGYIVPPMGFLTQLRHLCDKYDLLLIVDEIFTGFGRCGKWLAIDYENVTADILCVGKVMGGGFPAAACVAPYKIMQSLEYEGMVPLHGSTFVGNPLACKAISTTIHILKDENLIQKSYLNGRLLREKLVEVFSNVDIAGNIRGLGSASVIEFVAEKESKGFNAIGAQLFHRYLLEHGIVTLVTGLPYGNCVAFCPPFTMDNEQIQYILDVCEEYVKGL